MTPTVEKNWLVTARSIAQCGGLKDFELKSLEIGNAYDLLYAVEPSIIPTSAETGNLTLISLYNKIVCGTLLSETEYHWARAEIDRLKLLQVQLIDSQSEAAIETASHYVVGSGIHTWNDGVATAGDIPIAGLLATDTVHVTIHSKDDAEGVVAARATSGKIDVFLNGNGVDGTTKLNYTALRAMPAS